MLTKLAGNSPVVPRFKEVLCCRPVGVHTSSKKALGRVMLLSIKSLLSNLCSVHASTKIRPYKCNRCDYAAGTWV